MHTESWLRITKNSLVTLLPLKIGERVMCNIHFFNSRAGTPFMLFYYMHEACLISSKKLTYFLNMIYCGY